MAELVALVARVARAVEVGVVLAGVLAGGAVAVATTDGGVVACSSGGSCSRVPTGSRH